MCTQLICQGNWTIIDVVFGVRLITSSFVTAEMILMIDRNIFIFFFKLKKKQLAFLFIVYFLHNGTTIRERINRTGKKWILFGNQIQGG